ncbi:aminotransferase class IV [Desulfotruncus alcoholivorax]|uniref:aminotransferase class IV n=1 Tax=Desulfotruncus alcoholivorax TaxID=265477 RepID=UPI000428C6ED|nr:aminotransferase class IV [Desulfotruncus alcoholivorax]
MRKYHLIDGKPATKASLTIDTGDAGLLYGFSLFETVLVKEGRPVLLQPHLQRMAGSAAELELLMPMNTEDLLAMCEEGIEKSGIGEGVLRLAVTAGSDEDKSGKTILTIREGVPYHSEQYEKGFSIMTSGYPRNEKSPLVRHKTANYLENLICRKKAGVLGFNECLFLNTQGHVAECSASNVFVVKENQLITPPVDAGLLPGIVRGLVIDKLAGPACRCIEGYFNYSDLLQAEECFITNSIMGIMPVVAIDRHRVGDGRTGKLTRILMHKYHSYLKKHERGMK